MPKLDQTDTGHLPPKKGGCLSDLKCRSQVNGQHGFQLSESLSDLLFSTTLETPTMSKTIDPNIWDSILAQIAQGHSLSTVLTQQGSPSYSWCKAQLRQDADLHRRYMEACQDRADRLADDLVALADSEPPEHLDGPGRHAYVAQLRIMVDARKWTAAKLRPKVYSERVDIEVGQHQISIRGALEAAQARLLSLNE